MANCKILWSVINTLHSLLLGHPHYLISFSGKGSTFLPLMWTPPLIQIFLQGEQKIILALNEFFVQLFVGFFEVFLFFFFF